MSVAHKGLSKQDNYNIELCTVLKSKIQPQHQKKPTKFRLVKKQYGRAVLRLQLKPNQQ